MQGVTQTPRQVLQRMFEEAVAAASADVAVPNGLPPRPRGRTVVVGAGKAAAAMARAVEDRWNGPLSGLVVTRYGHAVPCKRIEVVEAAHPVPDEAGQRAAERILTLLDGLTADDLVICLISGGASALLTLPAPGVALEEKREVTSRLLRSGASIFEMNCVRKHLSAIKGGRLAARAHPAKVVTLAISDVPGDDPSVIGSGPTVPDPTTIADARLVLRRYGIQPPPGVERLFSEGQFETPKAGDPRMSNAVVELVATPNQALEAAAMVAVSNGYLPLVLGDAIEGEAREVARVMAGIVSSIRRHGHPVPAPCVLLSGGETTVTMRGKGKGGRNSEFLLALAVALKGMPGVHALACDTDGIDGSEDNAGAYLAPDSLNRARARRLDANRLLADNDSYGFFAGLGDLLVTGPTLTNVNDFRAILVE